MVEKRTLSAPESIPVHTLVLMEFQEANVWAAKFKMGNSEIDEMQYFVVRRAGTETS